MKQLTNWQLQYPTMASLRLILGPGVEGLVSAEVPWPPVSWEPSNRSDLRNKALRIENTLLQYFSSIYEYTSCIFLHWDSFYLRTWITINYFWTTVFDGGPRIHAYLHIRDRWTYWTGHGELQKFDVFPGRLPAKRAGCQDPCSTSEGDLWVTWRHGGSKTSLGV